MSAFIDIDPDWIRRARARDVAAWEQIYTRTWTALYTTIVRIVADPSEAEDLAQDSYVLAWQRLYQLDVGAALWPWLKQIGVHLTLSRLRSRARLELTETFDDDALGTIELEAVPDQARLLTALYSLKPVARAVLWLYEVEGYTHEEIAAELERTVSFSKSQLSRARAKLRALLEPNREVIA
jgi:RNA polymerase sigma factor (sigma-70 family)